MSNFATIQVRIEVLEQNAALHEEAQFRERTDVLDELELILDALAPLAAAPASDPLVATLHARARTLQRALVTKNEQFCDQLRARIAAGNYNRADLLQTFLSSSSLHSNDDLQYDNLDVLVNGMLRVGEPPEADMALEAAMVGYQPTPARLIVELVQRAPLDHADVFYDLGSGLGQVAIIAALLSGARTVGVEADPGLCAYAQRCATMLQLDRVEFRNEDARTANLSDGTVFYLYTPFHGHILQTVLHRLRSAADQRPIRVCTYGPCTATVAQQRWLVPDHDATRSSTLAFFRSAS